MTVEECIRSKLVSLHQIVLYMSGAEECGVEWSYGMSNVNYY